MRCESIQRLMYEAVDRALTSEERGRVDAHLSGCERCRSESAVLDALIETVEATPPEQPTDAFLSTVMERLPTAERSPWYAPSLVLPRLVFAVTLAAAVPVWVYRAAVAEFMGGLVPVQEALGPAAVTIRELRDYLQTQAVAAVSRLPEPVSGTIDWGSLLAVATTLVVGYVLVRTAESITVGPARVRLGKRT